MRADDGTNIRYYRSGERAIITPEHSNRGGGAGLSLLFPEGRRPTVADLRACSLGSFPQTGGFSVGHVPDADTGPDADANWVELVASGLSFDLSGLAPGAASSPSPRGHGFGLEPEIATERLEAVTLMPGSHLAGGEALLPVVRVMAGLGAALATLPGARAVCWHPARSWMEPGYYQRAIATWLEGGAFPALGLAALARAPDGGLVSEGLDFLVGQEIHVEGHPSEPPAEVAKLALRIMHDLVENGPIHKAAEFGGPDGSRLCAEPSADGHLLRIWRRN